MQYREGAPVLTDPVSVHMIYIGAWSAPERHATNTLLRALPTSPWWGVVRQYATRPHPTSPGRHPTTLALGATHHMEAHAGLQFSSHTTYVSILKTLIATRQLPRDAGGLYVMALAEEVLERFGLPPHFM